MTGFLWHVGSRDTGSKFWVQSFPEQPHFLRRTRCLVTFCDDEYSGDQWKLVVKKWTDSPVCSYGYHWNISNPVVRTVSGQNDWPIGFLIDLSHRANMTPGSLGIKCAPGGLVHVYKISKLLEHSGLTESACEGENTFFGIWHQRSDAKSDSCSKMLDDVHLGAGSEYIQD